MEMEDRYFLQFSSELESLLADNEIDLVKELRNQGLKVRTDRSPLPRREDVGTKDAALVILASGVTGVLLSLAFAKIFDAIGRNRKTLVKEWQLAPLLDVAGKPVLDANNNPIVSWQEQFRWAEASQGVAADTKASAKVGGDTLLQFTIEESVERSKP